MSKKVFSPLLVLLLPLIGVILFDLDWNIFDFLIMGLLILFFSIAINLILNHLISSKLRLILILMLVILFLLIWAELAVGVFGTPFAGDFKFFWNSSIGKKIPSFEDSLPIKKEPYKRYIDRASKEIGIP